MGGKTIGFVLLSGGVDSTTALTLAVGQLGRENIRSISVDYGQRHKKEINAARTISSSYEVHHAVLTIEDMPTTMLTDPNREIPSVSYAELPHGISPTYVPFRNGQLLSKLAGYIQATLKEDEDAIIYFGAHAEDSQDWAYPDCTPEFTGAMANAIFIGTYQKVRLVVPWQHFTKAEIIEFGARRGTPYDLTWSCYKGEDLHCGVCPTCRARKRAFLDAEVDDPTQYKE